MGDRNLVPDVWDPYTLTKDSNSVMRSLRQIRHASFDCPVPSAFNAGVFINSGKFSGGNR